MRAGDLRQRITIQHSTSGQDPNTGEQNENEWSNLMTVWAEVKPLTGRELYAAQQVKSELSHKVRIRYQKGIHSYMRAVMNGRIFQFDSVINVNELNKELEIMCIEKVVIT